ncbi:MAG: hypothetical protein PHN80_12475 [Hespellia sp.]|nr:hypothetical protein [Hespellia sp.]
MLEYEYAKQITKLLFDENEDEKIQEQRFQNLMKLFKLARFYQERGFLPDLIETYFIKKAEMIQTAKTVKDMEQILKPSKPYYDGNRIRSPKSPYYLEEEELMIWSLTSLQAPLMDVAYQRYFELFQKFYPEKTKEITS